MSPLIPNLGALGLVFGTSGYTISGNGTLTIGTSGIDASSLSGNTSTINNSITLQAPQTWSIGAGSTLTTLAVNNGGNLLTVSGGSVNINGAAFRFGRTDHQFQHYSVGLKFL